MPSRMPPGLELDQFSTIQLGSHMYDVVPQALPLLKEDLAQILSLLTEGDLDPSNILDFFTGSAHDLLGAFIPDLMPPHEWEGYPSKAAALEGKRDRDYAREHAPTGPQVKLAITVCFRDNGLDAWKLLGKLVDPTLLKAWITAEVSEWISRPSANASSQPAPTPSTTSSSPASPTEDDTGYVVDPTDERKMEEDWQALKSGPSSSPPDA